MEIITLLMRFSNTSETREFDIICISGHLDSCIAIHRYIRCIS